MPNVFISYRREDSAGRIRDRLAQHFGEAHVFFDVDDIPAGVDFVNTIQRRPSTCDALVAVIGKGWLTAFDSYGKHRLENEGDYVRVEIAAVLSRGTPVVPVLVGNAAMPQALDLPDLLKPLTRINAFAIRFNTFGQDVDRLISTIENLLKVGSDIKSTGEEGERQPRVTLPIKRWRSCCVWNGRNCFRSWKSRSERQTLIFRHRPLLCPLLTFFFMVSDNTRAQPSGMRRARSGLSIHTSSLRGQTRVVLIRPQMNTGC
jgi:TIR domain-containing protein